MGMRRNEQQQREKTVCSREAQLYFDHRIERLNTASTIGVGTDYDGTIYLIRQCWPLPTAAPYLPTREVGRLRRFPPFDKLVRRGTPGCVYFGRRAFSKIY